MQRVLMIGLILSAAAGLASAQDQQQNDDAFFLESIAPEGADAEILNLMPDPNEYEINLQHPSGLGLRRSFLRNEVELSGTPFDTGIHQFASTTATLSLSTHTTLGFTREETSVQDVMSHMVSGSQVTGMSLTQGFGGGYSETTLSLSRALHSETAADEGELSTLIQSLGLQTGFGQGSQLQATATRKESEEPGRLFEEGYQGHLTAALSGGEGVAHYEVLERLAAGAASHHRRVDLVAPFAMPGGTALAEHHLTEQGTDSSGNTERTTTLALPLSFVHRGATANYQEQEKIKQGVRKEQDTLAFSVPMCLLGHDSQLEHITTEKIDGDNRQEDRTLRLTASFDQGRGVLARTETLIPGEEGLQRRRLTLVESPRIPVGDTVTVTAGHRQEDVVGVESTRTSHLDLTAKPLKPLDISANYNVRDNDQQGATKDRRAQTVLSLSDTTSLRGSISEAEKLEGPATILRHLELRRDKRDERDLGLRVGYTSYGAQEEEEAEPTLLAQFTFGEETRLSLKAMYTEYHEKKLIPLAAATKSFELRAGDPTRLGLRATYVDQAGRPEPERSVGVVTTALGGALRLDYIQNPLGPRGKDVLLTDLYELGFQRKILGSVGLDLGYKFCEATEDTEKDHYFKLQLDGGQVARGGQIALSYLSGHFVPYPKKQDPPASLVDLSYEKRWPGEGRLTLSLRRETAPKLSVGIDDTVEAELKYQANF